MTDAIRTDTLGKHFRHRWALKDCSVTVPQGSVVALVGPNGAGKSTLLNMAVGLTEPTEGSIEVMGRSPIKNPQWVLPRVGFVAQDHPLYRRFAVGDMLTMGAKLNPTWDNSLAMTRLDWLGVPLKQKIATLSGGQQAQVALVLALAKKPELMVLDEPMASLDPVARREFLGTLMEAVADEGMTVLLSSHIIADLERVCDYLILISGGTVRLEGCIEEIVGRHKLLVGARRETDAVAHVHNVVQESHTERQTTLLVRTNGQIWDSSWEIRDVMLEELVLAYLGGPRRPVRHETARQLEEVKA